LLEINNSLDHTAHLLIGGIQEPRLIDSVSPGIRPGNRPLVGLELFGGDKFVVVDRVGDLRHSGRDDCGVDERRWMGSNEVRPSNKPSLYSS